MILRAALVLLVAWCALMPRFLSHCASGTLVYADVPVENAICRLYRDEDIRVQLQYDERGRLARTQVDMDPYKSLPIPGMERQFHWGR